MSRLSPVTPRVQIIVLVISSLAMGGAERNMSLMANYWVRHGRRVTLITFDSESEDFWSVDPAVNRVCLSLPACSTGPLQTLWRNLQRVIRLRRAIRRAKPDVVLSFLDVPNILTIIVCGSLKIPAIAAERVDPGLGTSGLVGRMLRRWIYPLAARVVTQTARAGANLTTRIRARTVVIPNPVIIEHAARAATPRLGGRRGDLLIEPAVTAAADATEAHRTRVIGVGRLEAQKRFDLLMRAFAIVKDRHREWRLDILGEGSLRPELEALRDELGLKDCVTLPGRISNVPAALRESDLFVLSSDFEGFPNALCEAMACGLPVIATDCPSGPREIIRDGFDGLLTPTGDAEALAVAMDRLMSSDAERERLGRRAVEVLERFGLEKVMGMWDDLFAEAAGFKGSERVSS